MSGAPRRLGVYALGFLWQPELRAAIAEAGWRVRPGVGAVDAIGVWGRRRVSARGRLAARLTGRPLVTIEDGFLRSVSPGRGHPVISLLIDDLGVHFDAAAPSRLEKLIEAGEGDLKRAAAGMARLRKSRLSKYNHAPRMENPPIDHVLVIDQTVGDASIAYGGADAASFERMLSAARAEHPDAEIIVKTHPETVSGTKPGHFASAPRGVSVFAEDGNPWDLIEGARAVYTVTSQLGMEALVAGKPVRCFGHPFYSGWGATEDETPVPRRKARRNVAEIFAAAYLDYPLYFDPWRGGLTDFETACDALATLRNAHERNRRLAVIEGARLWKRPALKGFFTGPSGAPRFIDDPGKAAATAKAMKARHMVWASRGEGETRIEDGFLRSRGLGAALTPPLSLAVDDEGIYYDPSRPSRLERLIANAPETAAARARADALRQNLIALGVTKYNLGGALKRPDAKRVILVPGQVEDDASILKGAGEIRINGALLEAVRAAAPDAFLIYKPHPDVEAGLRPGAVETPDADLVASGAGAAEALAAADEVWTMTSLMGFEALIRGKPVVTFGAPFYAGWGLTDDRGEVPARRTARPSLEALIHAVLIDYPIYRDPVSGLPCEPEVIVERLADGAGSRGPALGLLAKAQGLAASYAWLWR